MTDETSITVLSLEEKIALVGLLHQTHAGVCLVEAVARDVQAGRPLPDNVNELILCGDGLAEAHMLLLLLDSFNDRRFLLLELERN